MERATRAVVCGLPFSGNRLVRDLCKKAGVQAYVWHGSPYPAVDGPKGNKRAGCRAIIPVRDPLIQFSATVARLKRGENHPLADEQDFRADVIAGLAGIPTVIISYRSIVDDPIGTGRHLWHHLGVEPPPDASVEDLWGQEIYDGDLKYQEAAVAGT